MPYYQDLYDEHGKDGLGVIAVNDGDTVERIGGYIEKHELTIPIPMGGRGADSVHEAFGVKVYPTTYILDSEGRVLARFASTKQTEIDAVLEQYGFYRKD